MKSALLLLLCLLAFAVPAWGQSTTVSATITDQSGQAWKDGTFTFTFRVAPSNPSATYMWNGSPFTGSAQTIAGAMDASGHFSVSVPSNTSIAPAQSTWDLQVCSIALGNTPCFTQQSLTITGATQDLSFVHPPAISIDLAHPAYPFVVAYTSAEITTAPLGGLYYDWTQAHYFICEAITATGQVLNYGTCSNWVEICQFGDSSCGGGGGVSAIYQHNGTLVGQQPKLNFIDTGSVTFTLANDSGNSRVNVSAASSGGGSGCVLPVGGVSDGVLEENPKGTCDDSSHFTWNKANSLWQAGDGTNTLTDLNALFRIMAFGQNISVTSDDLGFGITDLLLNGAKITVNQSAASADIQFGFVLGQPFSANAGARISATNGSNVSLWGCLIKGCDDKGVGIPNQRGISADGSSGINVVFNVGVQNGVRALNASNNTSVFVIGEQNVLLANNGCNMSDNFLFGENNLVSCGTASTAAPTHTTILGNFDTIASTTQQIANVSMLGNTLTATQSSGSNISDIGLIGKNLTATNCSDCYGIGENFSFSANNTLSLGMSATPEIVVTAGSVAIGAWPVTKMESINFTGCTAGAGTYTECTKLVTWGSAFADANYSLVCMAHGTTNDSGSKESYIIYEDLATPKTASQFTLLMQNNRGSTPISAVTVSCIGVHP
jgi:hypothetical protein